MNPLEEVVVAYTGCNLISGAPGDTDASAGTIHGFVGYDFAEDKVWLDIFLYPKEKGRK